MALVSRWIVFMQSPKSPLVSPCQHLPTAPIRGLAWAGSLECGFKSKPHGAIAAVRLLTTWLAGLDHSSPLLAPQLGFGRRDGTGANVLNLRKAHLRQARCRPSPLDAVSNLHDRPWRWRLLHFHPVCFCLCPIEMDAFKTLADQCLL